MTNGTECGERLEADPVKASFCLLQAREEGRYDSSRRMGKEELGEKDSVFDRMWSEGEDLWLSLLCWETRAWEMGVPLTKVRNTGG